MSKIITKADLLGVLDTLNFKKVRDVGNELKEKHPRRINVTASQLDYIVFSRAKYWEKKGLIKIKRNPTRLRKIKLGGN